MHDTDLQTVLWQVFALHSHKELQNAILGEIPSGERVNKCSLGGHLFREGKENKKSKSFYSKGWRSAESARLPLMWFKSRRRRQM